MIIYVLKLNEMVEVDIDTWPGTDISAVVNGHARVAAKIDALPKSTVGDGVEAGAALGIYIIAGADASAGARAWARATAETDVTAGIGCHSGSREGAMVCASARASAWIDTLRKAGVDGGIRAGATAGTYFSARVIASDSGWSNPNFIYQPSPLR